MVKSTVYLLKLRFCEKDTILTLDLFYVVTVKSTVEILQNFVAFSEYMNCSVIEIVFKSQKPLQS